MKYFPRPIVDVVEPEVFDDKVQTHAVGRVRLVDQNQHRRSLERFVVEGVDHFLAALVDALVTACVEHKNDPLNVFVVILPKGSILLRTAAVPDDEVGSVEPKRLQIESVCLRRRRIDEPIWVLSVERAKYGGLPGAVEAY